LRCKGKNPALCGRKFCPIMAKIRKYAPKKIKLNFLGTSPPDFFVGHTGYPNVYAGILAPPREERKLCELSGPEEWFKMNFSIEDILQNRGAMIYSRIKIGIKNFKGRVIETMQEVSMANKECDVELFLKKKPKLQISLDLHAPPIGNPAPLKKIVPQENPKIHRKVDYVVSDDSLKASDAIMELYKSNFTITQITRILSAGLLGLKFHRKFVPTRWSITCVDDTISKKILEDVRSYEWVDKYLVFYGDYVGNHYEIIMFPRQWSFEVIEAKIPGSCWNPGIATFFMEDYENFFGRKTYASNVTGAYYSNRLAVVEYLKKIKRQASVLVLREAREEYYAPCGVGILRELSRNVFNKKPKEFESFEDLKRDVNERLKIPIEKFLKRSKLLKEINAQKSIKDYL